MGMAQSTPQANPMAGQDPDKLFRAEAENLELVKHEYLMDGIEERLINTI
jgi:ER membrane protein complex subunit 3